MAHITGRRLDIDDGSSLILFRTATTVLPEHDENVNAKISGKNYIENLKQQDLKANIEKLRFRRNEVKSDSSKLIKQSNTKSKNPSSLKLAADLNKLPSRNLVTQINVSRRNGTHVNPAETAEVRKKKALEWLQNEKREVYYLFLIFIFKFTYLFVIRWGPRLKRNERIWTLPESWSSADVREC
jgi:hypothetical protein